MTKITHNKFVSLLYELRETDKSGKIIEEMDTTRPLSFIFGTGRLIPGFESGIASLSEGDGFIFTVRSDDAYGERREDLILDVPIGIFENEGKINEEICFVGNTVPMSDSHGRRIDGIINQISDDFVRMDFNHPLAGCDLHFSGRILQVRDATNDEIEAVRKSSSCSSCGSNNGTGCSGEC
ncbi:MAG: FKBP-type peptidyl-prolyl cis-trans isomerase [Bacteroidales bacterium]|jgi:FKBP-type peptidyl-prolyl cis-trans isomerase SlyD|nr:FKBP-type peptidyl-prolyl cis-trans isomerase [Bacteroidales bacterium]